MFDASDAVDYVREITGDDVNIIFGAMYDANMTDYCRITVIATGIEETPANKFASSFAKKNAMPPVSGVKPSVNNPAASTNRPYTPPVQPQAQANPGELKTNLTGLQKPPTSFNSRVETKSLNIPSFLQKK